MYIFNQKSIHVILPIVQLSFQKSEFSKFMLLFQFKHIRKTRKEVRGQSLAIFQDKPETKVNVRQNTQKPKIKQSKSSVAIFLQAGRLEATAELTLKEDVEVLRP